MKYYKIKTGLILAYWTCPICKHKGVEDIDLINWLDNKKWLWCYGCHTGFKYDKTRVLDHKSAFYNYK